MTKARGSTVEGRVLVVVRYPVGGIRTYILYNYPILAQAGYRFTFVGPAETSFRAFSNELQSWEHTQFVEAPVVRGKCQLRFVVRRLLPEGRFSLIHSQGFTSGTEAVLANLGVGVPHVNTVHDVIRANQFPGLRGRLKLLVVGLLLAQTDVIIAPSEDARGNLFQYYPALRFRRHRVATVLHGIDVSRFQRRDCSGVDRLRGRLGLAPDVFLMGFFGRFMEQKGFLILIDAMERLLAEGAPRPFHLVAVGSGDYIRECRAEIARRACLQGHISFLDYTPDITPILRQVELVVMPSLWEACPLLPMEAMCAGIPVLGSNCVGLREVLRGSPSRMVPAGDSAALAAAIRNALVSPWNDEAQAYASQARTRFDVRQSAGKLRALFDQVGNRCARRMCRIADRANLGGYPTRRSPSEGGTDRVPQPRARCPVCQRFVPCRRVEFFRNGRFLECGGCHVQFAEYQAFEVARYYSAVWATGRGLSDPYGEKLVVYANERSRRDFLYAMPRFRWAMGHFSKLPYGSRVFDIGCGEGILLWGAQRIGLDVQGCDVASNAVDLARQIVGAERVSLGALEAADNPPQSFECVASLEVIEHRPRPDALLESASRMLKPTGLFLLTTPNRRRLFTLLKRAAGMPHSPGDYPPHHLTRWSALSLENLARQYFHEVRVGTLPYCFQSRFARSMARVLHAVCAKRMGQTLCLLARLPKCGDLGKV
jgi:glycosyltransferase involved in cell wall biosynthesis/SAM-dependent methyltransferase